MMAATDHEETQTGEERLRKRRNAFWRFSFIGMAVAFVLGLVGGLGMAMVEEGTLPATVVYLSTGLITASFIWFTIAYYRRVDELDLLDNLWAGLIGFYFYFVAFPTWNTLAAFDLLPQINHWVLYLSTVAVMFIAYGVRKLNWR